MAQAIGRALWGPTVSVESAGIEAGHNDPATKHAVATMAEMGIDIKGHRSRSVQSLDLSRFDLVIAMTPRIGETLVQLGVDVARIRSVDVGDPYGRGLDTYRAAAKQIERELRGISIDSAPDNPSKPAVPALQYLSEAVRRIETGEVHAGSHIAGIFSRCATSFEGVIRSYLATLLKACNLQYEKDIRPNLRGVAFEKTTLGNLVAGIERAAVLRPECVKRHIPPGQDLATFIQQLRSVNQEWARMKHREEVGVELILERMREMSKLWKSLMAESTMDDT